MTRHRRVASVGPSSSPPSTQPTTPSPVAYLTPPTSKVYTRNFTCARTFLSRLKLTSFLCAIHTTEVVVAVACPTQHTDETTLSHIHPTMNDAHARGHHLPTEMVKQVFDEAAVTSVAECRTLCIVSSWCRTNALPELFRTINLKTDEDIFNFQMLSYDAVKDSLARHWERNSRRDEIPSFLPPFVTLIPAHPEESEWLEKSPYPLPGDASYMFGEEFHNITQVEIQYSSSCDGGFDIESVFDVFPALTRICWTEEAEFLASEDEMLEFLSPLCQVVPKQVELAVFRMVMKNSGDDTAMLDTQFQLRQRAEYIGRRIENPSFDKKWQVICEYEGDRRGMYIKGLDLWERALKGMGTTGMGAA